MLALHPCPFKSRHPLLFGKMLHLQWIFFIQKNTIKLKTEWIKYNRMINGKSKRIKINKTLSIKRILHIFFCSSYIFLHHAQSRKAEPPSPLGALHNI